MVGTVLLGNKIQASRTFQSKSQNFVDISGAQKHMWANFWKLIFSFEKTRLYKYYQMINQLGTTSSPNINLTMKLLIMLYL